MPINNIRDIFPKNLNNYKRIEKQKNYFILNENKNNSQAIHVLSTQTYQEAIANKSFIMNYLQIQNYLTNKLIKLSIHKNESSLSIENQTKFDIVNNNLNIVNDTHNSHTNKYLYKIKNINEVLIKNTSNPWQCLFEIATNQIIHDTCLKLNNNN